MKWEGLESYGKRIMLLKDREVILIFKYVFCKFLGFILKSGSVGKFLGQNKESEKLEWNTINSLRTLDIISQSEMGLWLL